MLLVISFICSMRLKYILKDIIYIKKAIYVKNARIKITNVIKIIMD